jgi:hypothetical protein
MAHIIDIYEVTYTICRCSGTDPLGSIKSQQFSNFSGATGEIAQFPNKNTPKTPNIRPFKPGDSHQIPEFS